jgi:hypothetical protein
MNPPSPSLDEDYLVRHSAFLLATVCAAALLFLPGTSSAEINFGESIEWVVGDADRVFSGKVAKVEKVIKADSKDKTTFEVATVEVSRTFKGEPTPTVTFLLRSHNRGAAQRWLDDGVPLLFCLVATDRVQDGADELPKGFDWVIRDRGNNPSAYLLGKPKRQWTYTIDALTRNFEILTEPAAVTRHVEEYLKSVPAGWKKQAHAVEVPGHTAVYEKLWSGSAVYLNVPVDDELERLGRQMCQSDSRWDREEGAKILRHFKNDQNIAILMELLQDPTSFVQKTWTSEGGHGKMILVSRRRVYRVRTEAFKALQEFGVEVDPPLMEQPLELADEDDEAAGQPPGDGGEQDAGRGLGTTLWVVAGGVGMLAVALVTILCYWLVSIRHRRRRSPNTRDSPGGCRLAP